MPRWRLRIASIRSLLALILVVGVALAAWLVPYRGHRRQIADAWRLATSKPITATDTDQFLETRPCWQARLIGDKRTGPVTALRFYFPLTGEEIARVAEFRDLEILEFWDAIEPRGDGLAPLAGLPSLRSLMIDGSGWRDSDLAHLKDVRRLERLSLAPGDFTAAGVAHLGALSGLRELDLSCGEGWTDADLAFLGRMKDLRSLSLAVYDREMPTATDATLDVIQTLPNLERLTLFGFPITDDGLGRLIGLDRLEYLTIKNSKLDGRGLATLARLPRLRELRLWNDDGLSDRGLEQLRPATQLRSLCLIYNDGLSENCFGALKGMTHLEELRIANIFAYFSDEAVGELTRSLPGTKVLVDYQRADGTDGALSRNDAVPPW